MSKQIELVDSVLSELHKKGILEHLLIIGSWSLYFYKYHYEVNLPPLRTEDIDIDANFLHRLIPPVDLSELLKDLGFNLDFQGDGSTTYTCMLDEARFKIEFLVPETGRGQPKPKEIKGFGISAPRLRWLNILEEDPVTVNYKGFKVKVPQPSRFVIHKLIISQEGESRKRNPLKVKKDITQALSITKMLLDMGQKNEITDWLKDKEKRGMKNKRKIIRQALLQSRVNLWSDFTVKEMEDIFNCTL